MKKYRRKHNLSRIKLDFAYEYHEVALLLNVSKSTVRNWVKLGLPVMNAKRPPLINGAELKTFLKERQSKPKRKCLPDEFYCMSCKEPRRVWEGAVDVTIINQKKLQMSGICDCCEKGVSKLQPTSKIAFIAQTFNVQQWHGESILGRMSPHLNYHLIKESKS